MFFEGAGDGERGGIRPQAVEAGGPVHHDREIRAYGGAYFAAGISVVKGIRTPGPDLEAGVAGFPDPQGHVRLLLKGDMGLIGFTLPDARQIDTEARRAAAEEVVDGLAGDFSDGVPDGVLDTGPLGEPGLQVAAEVEQVLAHEGAADAVEGAEIGSAIEAVAPDPGIGFHFIEGVAGVLACFQLFARSRDFYREDVNVPDPCLAGGGCRG